MVMTWRQIGAYVGYYFRFCSYEITYHANLLRVDKKNQLDVTFCILYFSSNSCLTCFGQPCAHHQELTHYLPTGLEHLPAATAHTNTRL